MDKASWYIPFHDRDIPLPLVTSGCENSGNLRELALNRMKDFGAECRDVRFREVGVSPAFHNLLRSTFCDFLTLLSDSACGEKLISFGFRSMRFITKSVQNPSSFCGAITRRTGAGRRSCRMRIPRRTFSSACCGSGSAPMKGRSGLSWRGRKGRRAAAVASCGSCMCMGRPCRCTDEIRQSFSTR